MLMTMVRPVRVISNFNLDNMEMDSQKTNKNGGVYLFIGLVLLYLNIARGGGFTSATGAGASGYNMASFIIWVASIILIVKGLQRIIRNRKKSKTCLNKESEEDKENLEEKNLFSIHSNFHKNYQPRLDKIVKLSLTVGFLLISFSIAYSFFYLPYKKNHNFEKCLKNSEDTLKQKQQEINDKIETLDKEKAIAQADADQKREEFLKNNPKPTETGAKWFDIFNSPRHKWDEQYGSFLNPVREITWKINGLKKDLEIIQEEKKIDEDICYKKYK